MRDFADELRTLAASCGITRYILVTDEIDGMGIYGPVTRRFGLDAAHLIHVAVHQNFEQGIAIEDLSYTPKTAGNA